MAPSVSAELNEIFSRPLLATTFTITSAGESTSISPYSYLASNAAWLNRIKYSTQFRGTLHYRVVHNCTQYALGLYRVFYIPYPSENNGDWTSITRTAQVDNLLIDLADPKPVEGTVPFFSYYPAVDILGTISATGFTSMGKLWVGPVYATYGALGSTISAVSDPSSISIYVWFTDVELSGISPSGYVATAKRGVGALVSTKKVDTEATKRGPISVISSKFATAAKLLSDVPIIGPFASAFSVAASLASDVAALFGFSRPKDVDDAKVVIPATAPSMATTVGKFQGVTLTTDPLAGLSVGGYDVGLGSVDEMTVSNIARRWGLTGIFTWTDSNAAGTAVYSCPVAPGVISSAMSFSTTTFFTSSSQNLYTPSPLAFASSFFERWTGTLEYRLRITANKSVRGILQVRHFPEYDGRTTNANTGYGSVIARTCVMDLSQTNEIRFSVGWTSALPTQVVRLGLDSDLPTTTVARGSNVITTNTNGYFVIEVVQALTCPLSAISLTGFVWTRAGEDFAVFNPTNTIISGVGYLPTSATVTSPADVVCELVPSNTRPHLTEVIFGESQASFRAYLKRFFYIGTATTDASNGGTTFPLYAPRMNQLRSGTTNFSEVCPNPLAILSAAYAGARGGVRYVVTCDGAGDTFALTKTAVVSGVNFNDNGDVPFFEPTVTTSFYANNDVGPFSTFVNASTFATTGTIRQNSQQGTSLISGYNPAASFEVPDLSGMFIRLSHNNATAIGYSLIGASSPSLAMGAMLLFDPSIAGTPYTIHMAVAEDFSLLRFVQPPAVTLLRAA